MFSEFHHSRKIFYIIYYQYIVSQNKDQEQEESIVDEVLQNQFELYKFNASGIKDKKVYFVNPLKYHKLFSHLHPCVSSIAKQVYCICASSTSSERVFSYLKRMTSGDKNKTGSDINNARTFLKSIKTLLRRNPTIFD